MKTLVIKKLENTLNRYLHLDPDTHKLLYPLRGRVMGLHIQRPKISLFFSFSENNIQISTEPSTIINTEIYTTLFQLMRLKFSSPTTLINTQLHIKGDVETAQLFNELFEKHHVDWEEHLSKIVGDVTAHKMTRLLKKSSAFIKMNKSKFSDDCGEYLQEEAQLLPSHNEVKFFQQQVDALRLQIDRLQARVELLKRNHRPPSASTPRPLPQGER